MGKMRENPRYNVISMRISDEERAALDEILYCSNKSISQLMREALDMIKVHANPEMQRRAA